MLPASNTSNRVADAPIQIPRSITSRSLHQAGVSGAAAIQVAGERMRASGSAGMAFPVAAGRLTTSGSRECSELATIGRHSDATIAPSQIQRVPPRCSRSARSATNAPSDSSSVTVIT